MVLTGIGITLFLLIQIDLGGDLGLDKLNSVIQVGDQDNDGKDDIAPALCPGEILTMQTSFEGTPHQWWFQWTLMMFLQE